MQWKKQWVAVSNLLHRRAKAESTDTILQGQPCAWNRNVRGITACVHTSAWQYFVIEVVGCTEGRVGLMLLHLSCLTVKEFSQGVARPCRLLQCKVCTMKLASRLR